MIDSITVLNNYIFSIIRYIGSYIRYMVEKILVIVTFKNNSSDNNKKIYVTVLTIIVLALSTQYIIYIQ
jgi:branched-subunit amino acid transport protein AzlD